MATKIPWSQEEEKMLLELKESGLDWEMITKKLNKNFKHLRPKDEETDKPIRRSQKSVYWYHQRLRRRMKDNSDVKDTPSKPKKIINLTSKPKKVVTKSSTDTYRITITKVDGSAMVTVTTNNSDVVMETLRRLLDV